jgi:hypothetical protein
MHVPNIIMAKMQSNAKQAQSLCRTFMRIVPGKSICESRLNE